MKELKINSKEVPYIKIVESAELVVKQSFDANGEYKKYLNDFAKTCAMLTLFTDYDGDYNYEEVMELESNDELQADLLHDVKASYFDDIVLDMVESKTRPFAEIDNAIKAIKEFVEKLNESLSDIDIGKIKEVLNGDVAAKLEAAVEKIPDKEETIAAK